MAISMVGMVSPARGLAGRWQRKKPERGGVVRCSAAAMGMMSPARGLAGRWQTKGAERGRGRGVRCSAAALEGLTEQYRTLRVRPGATEIEVKKAFRQLALQYHPDVCKESNDGIQFHQINAAYDIIMDNIRRQAEEVSENSWSSPEWSEEEEDGYGDEPMRGMCDSSWDMWEEWMGWEGAGIRDYSSHINPYI